MKKISPMNKRILLQEEKASTTTASGIVVEGSLGDSKVFAVVEVGEKVEGVTVGDRLLVDLRNATMVSVDGKQYIVVDEEFVIAQLR